MYATYAEILRNSFARYPLGTLPRRERTLHVRHPPRGGLILRGEFYVQNRKHTRRPRYIRFRGPLELCVGIVLLASCCLGGLLTHCLPLAVNLADLESRRREQNPEWTACNRARRRQTHSARKAAAAADVHRLSRSALKMIRAECIAEDSAAQKKKKKKPKMPAFLDSVIITRISFAKIASRS